MDNALLSYAHVSNTVRTSIMVQLAEWTVNMNT